ncbi:hypothetical protein EXIGLDRAFT_317696 [Exidia glandulosa HHB12029]|uniref:Uncharacterized protein n=1 Tax=Exidia glandulosa HHB12029 TaxID=1314781 RepID=A0A165CWG3_EXIGL|nr:hypothetical protein EXIGLDRAFT_317696 [Exidia glandulosa HHB12029]
MPHTQNSPVSFPGPRALPESFSVTQTHSPFSGQACQLNGDSCPRRADLQVSHTHSTRHTLQLSSQMHRRRDDPLPLPPSANIPPPSLRLPVQAAHVNQGGVGIPGIAQPNRNQSSHGSPWLCLPLFRASTCIQQAHCPRSQNLSWSIFRAM